jgi:uncharacterized protein (UPF0276 family)
MDARRLGFGVGFNMPWGQGPIGFSMATAMPSQRLTSYLAHERFAYLMFSFQPRHCAALEIDAYFAAYEGLRDCIPAGTPLAFHQTTLNFGAPDDYDRSAVYAFTNELHRRLGLEWVNEDIGIWSHHGIPMPYPLPPFLIPESIGPTVAALSEAKAALEPPLHLEFPGFSDGYAVTVGHMEAYDWFREVVERADVFATLDTGHLLSNRWLLGHRGEALFADLDRLPLEHCREIHLSGCAVREDRFLDLHHGILLDEQIELLDRLIEVCPNLLGVTYEDPALNAHGRLPLEATPNVDRLRARVDRWMG